MYLTLKLDAESENTYNGNNWASRVKVILDEIGLSHLWLNQDYISINFQEIKTRILDTYKQTWYSSRLSSYNIFKHTFEMEDYFKYVNTSKYRISLTKFRLSSHCLAIEEGRYENIARENRICLNCNMNTVENEFHFFACLPGILRSA